MLKIPQYNPDTHLKIDAQSLRWESSTQPPSEEDRNILSVIVFNLWFYQNHNQSLLLLEATCELLRKYEDSQREAEAKG